VRARLRLLASCCLCILATAAPAAAEWHFAPFLGITFKGNTTIVDPEVGTSKKHPTFGGTVSLLGSGVLGAEGVIALTRGFFQTDDRPVDSSGTPIPPLVESSRVTALMGNLVLTTPRRLTEYFLRPFVSGGFGLLRVAKTEAVPPGVEVFPVKANFAGFNIGGGAVGFFSQRTGVRVDIRYFSTLRDTAPAEGVDVVGDKVHLRYLTASVALVIRR
jgi:hypothetical protein